VVAADVGIHSHLRRAYGGQALVAGGSCLPFEFMNTFTRLWIGLLLPVAAFAAEPAGDYVESFDTTYNSLTVEKRGSVVELRARSRRGEALESAIDLTDPLKLVVAYTRTLYAGLFFQPQPNRVLMIGLGGAGFHRLFAAAYPDALLQTV